MQTTLGSPTLSAILSFLVIVALTLAVTYWAARRTRSTREFYAAGRSISPFQNGLALAGDYMSAASFLGITGLVALRGYDGMIYATGWLVGWPALMFLIAEPLRNLGKFTFADVVAFRLRQVPVRIAAAFGGILTLLFYVLAQMVGAGNLITLMFGLSYEWAVITVGAVMLAYVLFGGMIATTWVQIIKAILLLCGVTVLTAIVLARFHFSPGELYAAVAERYGQAALEPGGLVSDPVDAISLGLALMFGLLGLPHILMRFYTVPDARAARASVLYATGFIGYFYLIIPVVGFGASALVGREIIRSVDSGGNMAAPLVAELLGGTPFLGFIAAVAFATILAVVAGLTLAASASFAHDVYANVIRRGKADPRSEIRVARLTAIVIGLLAIVGGIVADGQNVAFLVSLALALAASANLPTMLYTLYWKRFNTSGTLWSIYGGLVSCLVLIVFSPAVSGTST
jgi:cation/acetate symporter